MELCMALPSSKSNIKPKTRSIEKAKSTTTGKAKSTTTGKAKSTTTGKAQPSKTGKAKSTTTGKAKPKTNLSGKLKNVILRSKKVVKKGKSNVTSSKKLQSTKTVTKKRAIGNVNTKKGRKAIQDSYYNNIKNMQSSEPNAMIEKIRHNLNRRGLDDSNSENSKYTKPRRGNHMDDPIGEMKRRNELEMEPKKSEYMKDFYSNKETEPMQSDYMEDLYNDKKDSLDGFTVKKDDGLYPKKRDSYNEYKLQDEDESSEDDRSLINFFISDSDSSETDDNFEKSSSDRRKRTPMENIDYFNNGMIDLEL